MKNKISRRAVLLSGAATVLAVNSKSEASAVDKKSFDHLDHEKFMRLAIEQAQKVPNCPFGAVVINIKTEKVVAEGWVRVEKNPIWHGEMTAIYNCPDSDRGFDWREVALYTTGESCPMCQSAIIWTKMPLVVYGSSMPFLQSCDFGQIDIRAQTVIDASRYGKCAIIGGVLESECNKLFKRAKDMVGR
ncbi:MAG: nucleoside deaminase [Candidatus Obscuribacterales bacterium]|nr:nucleoside deaminase [Candidatus Obscuribacterales bacterium]